MTDFKIESSLVFTALDGSYHTIRAAAFQHHADEEDIRTFFIDTTNAYGMQENYETVGSIIASDRPKDCTISVLGLTEETVSIAQESNLDPLTTNSDNPMGQTYPMGNKSDE